VSVLGRNKEKMRRIDGIKTVVVMSLVLLALSTTVISVDAHMPGATAPPEFELEHISIYDGDTLLEITIDSPDYELFEGVEEPEEEEPDVMGGAIFFSILVTGLILLLGLAYSRKEAT